MLNEMQKAEENKGNNTQNTSVDLQKCQSGLGVNWKISVAFNIETH